MAAERPHGGMLTSWKEIAGFFDRDARTVQRWEKEEGLPVHRHRHQRQSSVYAYIDELDAWWKKRGAALSEPVALTGTAPAVPPFIPDEATPAAGASASSDALPDAPGRWRRWRFNAARLGITRAALAITAALLVLGILASIVLRRSSVDSQHVLATLDGSTAHGELYAAAISDFNGDGRNDLAVATRSTREIHLIFGGSIPNFGEVASAANVTIRGTENGDYVTTSVADLDGDGMRDLLVSVLLREPDTFRATGASYLLRGRRTWPRSLELPRDASVRFGFTRPKDIRMAVCSSINPLDLNGDGIEDLLLGGVDFSPPGLASAGGIWVLFGRRTWPSEIDVERDADITILGSRAGEGLVSGCNVGDFNGDDKMDLAVIAGEHTLWNMLGGRGRSFLFLGRDDWPRVLTTDQDADLRIDGERTSVAIYAPVLADLNGDGFDDLFLGSTALGDQPVVPQFAMFFGAAKARSGVHKTGSADVVIDGDFEASSHRIHISAGDLDGDGMGDVILAGADPGRVHVLFGRSRWPAKGRLAQLDPVELFRGEIGLERATFSLGDLDEDGLPDLAVPSQAAAGRSPESSERVWLLSPYRRVKLDVRPGYEPNVLYLPGVLVAKVDGKSFAASDPIEPASVRLAGVSPMRAEWRDLDGDGAVDLLLYFETREMRVTLATTRVTLTARTRSGRLVAGHDSVTAMSGTADQLSDAARTTDAQTGTRRR